MIHFYIYHNLFNLVFHVFIEIISIINLIKICGNDKKLVI
jgi:hypothetical protein